MFAAIYARYSTDLQRDASIEDQIRSCKARIDQEGWTLVASYADHALSGSIRLRPGYQKLLEDARTGQFEVVVAEALDRLSRDQEDVAALYKHLSFSGVKLITIGEGEISELHVGLKGTMNALFLKDLRVKVKRGLEGRVRQGRSGGGLGYGYDVVREYDSRGELIRGGRKSNEAEAAIVCRIFAEFAAGTSPRAIAKALNAEEIPGPFGSTWGPSTIYGNWRRATGILNNQLYIGWLVWNRQRFVKDPATGKRIGRLNDEREWVVEEVPELRII
jgi:site-specific DNA recombinase